MASEGPPPRPYLTRERTDELLEILGFEFEQVSHVDGSYNRLVDTPPQRLKFSALIELISGAIVEYNNDEEPDEGWEQLNQELLEFSEEYLVG